jgi:hypothetical protein
MTSIEKINGSIERVPVTLFLDMKEFHDSYDFYVDDGLYKRKENKSHCFTRENFANAIQSYTGNMTHQEAAGLIEKGQQIKYKLTRSDNWNEAALGYSWLFKNVPLEQSDEDILRVLLEDAAYTAIHRGSYDWAVDILQLLQRKS